MATRYIALAASSVGGPADWPHIFPGGEIRRGKACLYNTIARARQAARRSVASHPVVYEVDSRAYQGGSDEKTSTDAMLCVWEG